MRIVQINRFRLQVATKATTNAASIAGVHELFHAIDSFDLHAWARGRNFVNEAITLSLGQVFLVAVRLYAILTLCRSELVSRLLVASRPDISKLGGSTHHILRKAETRELVKLLRQLWPTMTYIPALQWPLIVAGVGVAGDLRADQAFIDQCLFSVWHYPFSDNNIFRCLEKLRVFWASGKNGWEDCFNEPVPC